MRCANEWNFASGSLFALSATFRSSAEMVSSVKALGIFPSLSSQQHGSPLLRRVRASPRSPTSSLLCDPPIPLTLRLPLWFPSRFAYPSRALLLGRIPRTPADACLRRRFAVRASFTVAVPAVLREDKGFPGFWTVFFVRAAISDPAVCAATSPKILSVPALLPSGSFTPWADGIMNVSRLSFRGSLARVPTHRHVGYPYSWRKARYRPAGLALTGRDSHPLDGLPSFGFYLIFPLLSDQDFLVARMVILPSLRARG